MFRRKQLDQRAWRDTATINIRESVVESTEFYDG